MTIAICVAVYVLIGVVIGLCFAESYFRSTSESSRDGDYWFDVALVTVIWPGVMLAYINEDRKP